MLLFLGNKLKSIKTHCEYVFNNNKFSIFKDEKVCKNYLSTGNCHIAVLNAIFMF